MKVLVTGATGFVGREIVDELEKNNFEVVRAGGKSIRVGEFKTVSSPNCFSIDVSDDETLAALERLERVDAVVHSAGLAHQFKDIKSERFEAVNIKGTKNIANLAVKLKARQFILISSTAVYGVKTKTEDGRGGISEIEIKEDAECRPETIYAESKLAAEAAARAVCEKSGTALTILRLAPVIGEDNRGNAERLTEAVDRGRFLWVGSGENLKTLIYKRDVARACAVILRGKKNGTEIFNLAAAPIKMADFVRIIAAGLDRRIPGVRIPARLPKLVFAVNEKTFNFEKIKRLASTVEKWLSDDVYSAEKIAAAYGFRPETSIETALERQVAAYGNKRKKI